MPENYYRTGQAARQLGVSSYHIRRLCETGEIAAEITDGQQWKISAAEIARLQRDGLPEIPVELEDERDDLRDTPDADGPSRVGLPDGLLAAPSTELIEAAEEVKVAENRLRKRRIERDAEMVEDFFRDRERRQTELLEAERRRAAQAEAQQLRQKWLDSWIQYALSSRPCDAPRETELEIHEAVQAVLANVQCSQRKSTTLHLVDAAVEKALRPWKRKKEVRAAIECAVNRLHSDILYHAEWAPLKQRAVEAATAAVLKLPADSTRSEMDAATAMAVQPMAKEHAHAETCRNMAMWITLAGGTTTEDRAARDAVAKALAQLPVGAPGKELEKTKEAALQPFRAAIQQRKAEQDKARKRTELERRVDSRLSFHVRTYLDTLDGDEVEFDDPSDRQAMETNLKSRIRPILLREALDDPEISDEDLDDLIEEMVDEHLGEFLED